MKRFGRVIAMFLALCLLTGLGPSSPALALGSHPFTDLPGGQYDQVIATLWEYGVVTGLEQDKFVPAGTVTRAQMAALIVRAMGKTGEADLMKSVPNEFSDIPETHWARGVIAYASRAGLIKGDAGRFYPNDTVNYAQAATMLVRALGYENQVAGGYPSGYVLKANELELLKDVQFELYGAVNRAEAAVLLYNAIFRAPHATSGLTFSQTVFKRATAVQLQALPNYVAPGQEIPLSASVTDKVGKPIPDALVEFRVTSGSGEIKNKTLIVADGGAITVQATSGALTSSATTTPVSSLAITPAEFQANKGGSVQLTATALSGGQRVPVQPQWTVTQGPATVNSQGLLTVNDYGSVSVQATLGNLKASAAGQAVGKVTITAKPEVIVPGQSYTLAAVAADSKGQSINVPITWTAIGATIDRNSGLLTNATGNNVTVRATAAGITEEAVIPVIKSITISPSTASVLSGRTVHFTAKGVDSAGKQYSVVARWNRTNPTIGVMGVDGTFAGTNSGSTEVTAEVGSLVGRAQVSVAGEPARINVVTSTNVLPAGAGTSATIKVRLLDASSNLSPVSDKPISFTLTDSSRGSLSRTLVLTTDGEATVTYTPGATAGVASIVVAAPGTSLSSQVVTLSSYQPTPMYVELTATPQPLATGGGVAVITATLRDSNNFAAPAAQDLYVTLTALNSASGSLTGNVIRIPAGQVSSTASFISGATPGTVQITGSSTYQVRSLTLQTSTPGAASKVKIRPIAGATPVTGLSSLQVKVEVLDSAGVMRANDNATQVKLVVSGLPGGLAETTYTAGAAGGVATFQIPAYAVGTATLTASLPDVPGAPVDTAQAEFVPGVFSSLKLTAQTASLAADGFSQTQIIAEVVDRSGVAINTINPVVTFRKLIDGGATSALTDLTVQSVGGRAILTVQASRLAASDTWYATAPGLDTQNLAVVSTSATSGDAYTLRVQGSTSMSVNGANTLVIQVVDQQGRLVTTDTGRVITATHSMQALSIQPVTATTQNGVATFILTNSQAGSGTITFTSSGLAIPSVQSVVTFGGASATAYSLFASSSANTARVNNAVTVWVRVMDSQGSVLSTDNSRTISVTQTGGALISPSSVVTSSGLAVFTVTGTTAGQVSLTFTAPGLTLPTTQLTLTFTD